MTQGKKPSHHVYTVRDYEKDGTKDAFWTKIGVAFAHKDADGFDVLLDALPVSGRLVIRKPKAGE